MLASLLIVFREVLEAGLVIGIVLAATQGVPHRTKWIGGGIAAGVAMACLLAVFAGVISDALAGAGQEVFNSTVLIIAVGMLGWHQIWMASHGREIAVQMRTLGEAVALGRKSLLAMAVVVAIAVLREGSEVVLFLYGVVVSSNEPAVSIVAGSLLGIGSGVAVACVLYRGLVAIPVAELFRVTGWLIALLAAGMAGQAAAILAGADLIPSWGDQLWDTSRILPDSSLVGRSLHALIGYSDRPRGVQVAAYLVVLIVLVGAGRLLQQRSAIRRKPAAMSR
jgi:high-affinity iron transporter